jgi:salicylate hydroxylase
MNTQHIAIAGAGIGGLGAALALSRAGQRVTVLEQAAEFAEVGAGIQLGPNAMKVLAAWGLQGAVLAQACLPEAIAVRDAMSGRGITRILLGRAVQQRYGEVYATIHRADLHQVLLSAVQREDNVQLYANTTLLSIQSNADGLALQTSREPLQAQALVGADGLWSRVREHVMADGAPHFTGHVAYRSLLPRNALPPSTAQSEISVWWAPKLHVVGYPVRGGALYNLVVLAEGAALGEGWNFEASAAKVQALLSHSSTELQALTHAAKDWRTWPLYQRKPRKGWARGPVTLLGDAAHPMLPYLAQGAAMALEDAATLAHSVKTQANFDAAFQHYEQARYRRNAKVVQTAKRNAWIFHASGATRTVRDAVLALKGTEVLGMPWLYEFDATN